MALLLAFACAGDATSPPVDEVPARMRLVAGDTQFATVANAVRVPPLLEVQNAGGKPLSGITVTFEVIEGAGWTERAQAVTDASGRVTTAWYLGPVPGSNHQLRAVTTTGTSSGTFRASALPLKPDSTYFGRNDYIEFRAGSLPLVVSAPHGGTLAPAALPDRTGGETVLDANTIELARAVGDAVQLLTGKRPHLVLCRLARTKLDANREINEAAQGSAAAELAWREWHGFLEAASAAVDTGLYLDLHGHGHAVPRVELGYLLAGSDLALSDAQLNTAAIANRSSIRAVAGRSSSGLVGLLRGPSSLGALLESRGFPAVPSPSQPAPGNDPYFTGGYDTDRHGSRHGGQVDAIQLEIHRVGARDTEANWRAFGAALAGALQDYFPAHYGRELR